MNFEFTRIFDFTGKTIVITGGAVVLCSELASSFFDCVADVALIDVNLHLIQQFVKEVSCGNTDNKAMAIHCNLLDVRSIQEAISRVIDEYGKIDAVINGAGGNNPDAMTNEEQSFINLAIAAFKWVFDLNIIGLIIPSMNAFRPHQHCERSWYKNRFFYLDNIRK